MGINRDCFARYDNWSQGNRTAKYTFDTPLDNEGYSPKGVDVAGDYIFMVPTRKDNGSYGSVNVYDAKDGSYVGYTNPDVAHGWTDIAYPIRAFKRSNGEYLVLVQEDKHAKNMLYRWCPSGNCSQALEVNLTNPSKDTGMVNPGSLEIRAAVEKDTSTVEKVKFYVNDTLIGADTDSPYSYNWEIKRSGNYKLSAKAITISGGYKLSSAITVDINDGSPTGEIVAPYTDQKFSVFDSVLIEARANDYDGSIGIVSFYYGDTLICNSTESPYRFNWAYPPAGNHTIYPTIIDSENRKTNTSGVSISVSEQQKPYDGIAPVVKATETTYIPAWKYDRGVAYYDDNPGNAKGSVRANEGVDVSISDLSSLEDIAYLADNRDVGNWREGEWIEYTI